MIVHSDAGVARVSGKFPTRETLVNLGVGVAPGFSLQSATRPSRTISVLLAVHVCSKIGIGHDSSWTGTIKNYGSGSSLTETEGARKLMKA